MIVMAKDTIVKSLKSYISERGGDADNIKTIKDATNKLSTIGGRKISTVLKDVIMDNVTEISGEDIRTVWNQFHDEGYDTLVLRAPISSPDTLFYLSMTMLSEGLEETPEFIMFTSMGSGNLVGVQIAPESTLKFGADSPITFSYSLQTDTYILQTD